jgi:ribosomal protein S18 acetylase RimI-like enzyme
MEATGNDAVFKVAVLTRMAGCGRQRPLALHNDEPLSTLFCQCLRIYLPDMDIKDHISLRSATKSDAEFARVLHHRALRDVVVRQFGPWDEELQDGFFKQSGFPDGFEVIQFDGTPCGYVRTEVSGSESEVHNLYIDPDYQRKGIGTLLIKQVIAIGRPVRLQVLFENTEAADLYKRLGFRVVGSSDTHFQMLLSQ